MFWPLKGRGVSPRRFRTLQSAAVISDLPAPLLVPKTINEVCLEMLVTSIRRDPHSAALQCVVFDLSKVLEGGDRTCSSI